MSPLYSASPSIPALSLLRYKSILCSTCLRERLPPSLSNSHCHIYFHPSRRRYQSTWASAVSAAQNVISKTFPGRAAAAAVGATAARIAAARAARAAAAAASADSSSAKDFGIDGKNKNFDPFRILGGEMKFLSKHLKQLLGSGHPLLDRVAKYYTQSEGKHMRPLIVLLMSRATALTPREPGNLRSKQSRARMGSRDDIAAAFEVNEPISPSSILSDLNPSSPLSSASTESLYQSTLTSPEILPTQRRLAEITELIHTASLLHDDVIDVSLTRRASPSANIQFGNKMAVLAGDFLLGRASVALARLRDAEVVELLATAIANLVEGEFMQLQNTALDESNPLYSAETMNYYLQKTYLKTASLISKSCRAAALLGGSSSEVIEAAYTYGRNLGLAFQLVDDMLDYTSAASVLGKPSGADLKLGLATAPLLFAWETHPELGALVGRKFGGPGDVKLAREIVLKSDGMEKTRALAESFANKAVRAISGWPEGDAKEGLKEMARRTMERKK
ncbi:MAG: coq1 putative hexaprenyl diphosphate synthase [Cirrosporium novae-zelandiae]|nr:MAG: coq1 putative hexaprenyl diphosphate synthase [Cirrosporium novae-zelandiae]